MPDFVFADAKIGARTWRTGVDRANQNETPTCIIAALLRTQVYNLGNHNWSVSNNEFSVNFGPGANTRAELYFGLSNRVRSIKVIANWGSGTVPASAPANNFLRVNLWRLDAAYNATYPITTAPAYPTDQLLLRVLAGDTEATTEAEVNISAGTEPIYGCGFGMHLEARIGGDNDAEASWDVSIIPSESLLP